VTVFRATQRNPPTLRLDRLRPSDLLLLPPSSPSLFSTAPPHLSTFTSTYQLYLRRDSPSSPLLPLTPPPLFAQSRPLHSFTTAASENPLLARLLPTSTTPPIPLPNPTLPRPSSFTLYDLPRPFSAAELRQKVAEQRHSTARRGQFWLRGLGDKEIEDFWKWLRGGDPGAREKDTVWRLVYGATPPRRRRDRGTLLLRLRRIATLLAAPQPLPRQAPPSPTPPSPPPSPTTPTRPRPPLPSIHPRQAPPTSPSLLLRRRFPRTPPRALADS
ncbi:hypothetical protein BCR35DRAFT_355669, partial [Leucosporidium creatinivorum]